MTNSRTTQTSLLLIFLGIIYYILKYAFNAFLSNHLSPAYYGDFSIALRMLGISSVLTLLGTDSSSKRFLSKYLQHDDSEKLHHYLHWNFKQIRNTFIWCVGLVLLLIITMFILHAFDIYHIKYYHTTIYVLWLTPLSALALLLGSFLISGNHGVLGFTISNVIRYLLLMLFFIAAALYFEMALSATTITFIMGINFLALILIELFALGNKVPMLLRQMKGSLKTLNQSSLPAKKKWAKVANKLVLSSLLITMYNAAGLLIIELFVTNEHDTAYYAAMLTITNSIITVPVSAFTFIQNRISTLIKTAEGREELQRLVNQTNLVMLLVAISITLLIMVFSHWLLSLFGSEYTLVTTPLIFFSAVVFVSVLTQAASLLLSYSGNEKIWFYCCLLQLGVLLPLGIIMCMAWGLWGILIANLCANLTALSVALYFTRKRLNMKALILL